MSITILLFSVYTGLNLKNNKSIVEEHGQGSQINLNAIRFDTECVYF